MQVTVVDYNTAWPEMFRREPEALGLVLGDKLLRIFHIGSTAVPGLRAKPIIGMMPVEREARNDTGRRHSCHSYAFPICFVRPHAVYYGMRERTRRWSDA